MRSVPRVKRTCIAFQDSAHFSKSMYNLTPEFVSCRGGRELWPKVKLQAVCLPARWLRLCAPCWPSLWQPLLRNQVFGNRCLGRKVDENEDDGNIFCYLNMEGLRLSPKWIRINISRNFLTFNGPYQEIRFPCF